MTHAAGMLQHFFIQIHVFMYMFMSLQILVRSASKFVSRFGRTFTKCQAVLPFLTTTLDIYVRMYV